MKIRTNEKGKKSLEMNKEKKVKQRTKRKGEKPLDIILVRALNVIRSSRGRHDAENKASAFVLRHGVNFLDGTDENFSFLGLHVVLKVKDRKKKRVRSSKKERGGRKGPKSREGATKKRTIEKKQRSTEDAVSEDDG